MRVADVVRTKGDLVATVAPDAPIAEAVATLREMGIGAVVVSADRQRIDGILSERDVVRALDGGEPNELLQRPVADIMTTEVVTCRPNDRIERLMALMTERRIRHLPVEFDGRLAGIVSIGDVVASRLSELEAETRAMEEYIHHGR